MVSPESASDASPTSLPGLDPEGFRRERNRRVALGAGAALGGRGLTLALSLLTVPLALNYLGPERYGMWLTISSLVALLSFSDLGIGFGLLNSLTRSLPRNDPSTAQREISSALAVLAALTIAIAAAFAAIYPFVEWPAVFAVTSAAAREEAGPAVAAFAAIFLAGLPLAGAVQIRVARQETHVVHIAAGIGNIVSLGALLLVIYFGLGVPALVVAMSGPPLVATAVHVAILFWRDAPELRPSLSAADRRVGLTLMRAGFLFLVLQMSATVAFATDTIVITQVIGPEAVADYGVVHTLFLIPMGLVGIAVAPLWPAYGEAITRGDMEWTRSTLRRSLALAVVVTVPSALVLMAFGTAIIAVWAGDTVQPTTALLVGFGIWAVQGSVGRAVAMFLNGAREIAAQTAAAVVMALSNLILSIWLTNQIGVAGAIWGTVIAYGLFVLIPMTFYVPRVIGRIETSASPV